MANLGHEMPTFNRPTVVSRVRAFVVRKTEPVESYNLVGFLSLRDGFDARAFVSGRSEKSGLELNLMIEKLVVAREPRNRGLWAKMSERAVPDQPLTEPSIPRPF